MIKFLPIVIFFCIVFFPLVDAGGPYDISFVCNERVYFQSDLILCNVTTRNMGQTTEKVEIKWSVINKLDGLYVSSGSIPFTAPSGDIAKRDIGVYIPTRTRPSLYLIKVYMTDGHADSQTLTRHFNVRSSHFRENGIENIDIISIKYIPPIIIGIIIGIVAGALIWKRK